jgi:hypothetical protein
MEGTTVKLWKLTLAAILGLVLIIPLTAVAATSLFDDVADTNPFVDDINWMKTSGITNGCNSAGTEYCPADNLTRQQMAAFMHRLATSRAVDAGTLDGKNSTAFVMNTKWVSNTKTFEIITEGNQVTLDVFCAVPQYVVSGGGQSTYPSLHMATSQPLDGNKWRVTWTNTGTATISETLTVWALCAGPTFTAIP